ncbi:hypothetical protein PQR14_11875 [Paraburkholderia bryophila]|uniref:hypothetical protein n=1 Tax=Paraburkholderia bryophila TaxID=420952 RepID=UPI0038BC8704
MTQSLATSIVMRVQSCFAIWSWLNWLPTPGLAPGFELTTSLSLRISGLTQTARMARGLHAPKWGGYRS